MFFTASEPRLCPAGLPFGEGLAGALLIALADEVPLVVLVDQVGEKRMRQRARPIAVRDAEALERDLVVELADDQSVHRMHGESTGPLQAAVVQGVVGHD